MLIRKMTSERHLPVHWIYCSPEARQTEHFYKLFSNSHILSLFTFEVKTPDCDVIKKNIRKNQKYGHPNWPTKLERKKEKEGEGQLVKLNHLLLIFITFIE